MQTENSEQLGKHFVGDICKPDLDLASPLGFLKFLKAIPKNTLIGKGLKEFGPRGILLPQFRSQGNQLLKDFIAKGGTHSETPHTLVSPTQFNFDGFPPLTFFETTGEIQIDCQKGIPDLLLAIIYNPRSFAFGVMPTSDTRIEGTIRTLGVVIKSPNPERNIAVVNYGFDRRILEDNNPSVWYEPEFLGKWEHLVAYGPPILGLAGRYDMFGTTTQVKILQPGEIEKATQKSINPINSFEVNISTI